LHVSLLPAVLFGSLTLVSWAVWRLQHRLLDRIESGIREGRLIPDTDGSSPAVIAAKPSVE
jgi:hypothetical protein